ncbi:MAG: bifunctional pyr operon transcriptional regulator/uracil phosphoribosyltransferase PyrR [Lentisphaerae bacterium]|nr:bifunctional pyr operon transcriptional regulator/uracil phosphoribosyltransferase PyrR [Lentisphaerota bacterium]
MDNRVLLRNADEMRAAVEKVADSIICEFGQSGLADVALLGLFKAGVPLAGRIAEVIKERTGVDLACGTLDISMYRDDFGQRTALPLIRETEIPFAVDNARLILVDDVLSTGRTIRAALDAVTDYGRPALIRLAVLVDRGGVEYPIRADYIGWTLQVQSDRKVLVEFSEEDGSDGVYEVAWQRRAE